MPNHFVVDFDLENNPLFIKTNNLERTDELHVKFLAASGANAGEISIHLTLAPNYGLSHCGGTYTDFGNDASYAVSNFEGGKVIWTITKTPGLGGEGPRIEIKLNEELIVNFKISSTSCQNKDWIFWKREVKKIQFFSYDTASDFYKPPPKKCERLPTGWKNIMKTDPVFPVDKGITLTVSCTGSYELVGDSEITCNGNNDEFDYTTQPRCGKLLLVCITHVPYFPLVYVGE